MSFLAQRMGIFSPLQTGAGGALLTDLLAYWDMDEASGSRMDGHTNSLDLTDNNTVGSTAGVGGTGTAANFVAANSEYLSFVTGGTFNTSAPFTFCIWAKTPSDPAANTAIFDCYSNSPTDGGFKMNLFTNGRVGVTFADATGTARSIASGASTDMTPGTWHFFVVGHDGTNMNLSMDLASPLTSANSYRPTTSGKTCGFGRNDISVDVYADISIGPAAMWGRVLSAPEIVWLYNTKTAARLYADLPGYS